LPQGARGLQSLVKCPDEFWNRFLAEGRLGVKSGKGFFDYGGRSPDEMTQETNVKLIRLREFLKQLGEL